ncbi:hypothetical protein A1O3_01437 [Capronia epimyces CBS 606.96]|uniref:Thioesterase domain-containing protein n=1 Tax=Capronia epimyces CBS 606.96 TaxID=1182542 RepID=W9YK27_9EURO|nr:uncharacterized protein A1O3_01437 [Capronia epimyces CBS 606.96]EXJ92883.1 hypothetical protein A1O3_01437 [Capronia epimyces CBS 606.96]
MPKNSGSKQEQDLLMFESIPWCKKILDDAEFVVEPSASRTPKAHSTEDALLSRTLKTNDTIEGWVSLYRRGTSTNASSKHPLNQQTLNPASASESAGPNSTSASAGPNSTSASTGPNSSASARPNTTSASAQPTLIGLKSEVRTLLSLRPGLDGYPGICHGGIVATLLDEVMSVLVSECRRSQGPEGLSPGLGFKQGPGTNTDTDNVTADLHITYLKPVPTPAVVLCWAKIRAIQGRKYFVDGAIVNENTVMLARAEGLFIGVKKEKL